MRLMRVTSIKSTFGIRWCSKSPVSTHAWWISSFVCVCVCVCVRAVRASERAVRACVRACVWVWVCVCVGVWGGVGGWVGGLMIRRVLNAKITQTRLL